MDGQKLCGIKSILTERILFFFFIIIIVIIIISRSPSNTGVIKDSVLVSFNLSILIHHEIGRESREHVYAAQYAGAPLSVSLLLFSPSFKCIRRQITLISECYEADKRRNKAQTIRGGKSVTCRWTSRGGVGGCGNIIRDLQGKKQTFVPLI